MENIYREARLAVRMSLEKAAELLLISEKTLRNYELFVTDIPSLIINQMAVVYNNPLLPLRHCLRTYKFPDGILDGLDNMEPENMAGETLEFLSALELVARDRWAIVGTLTGDVNRLDAIQAQDNVRRFVRSATRLTYGNIKKTAYVGASTYAAMG